MPVCSMFYFLCLIFDVQGAHADCCRLADGAGGGAGACGVGQQGDGQVTAAVIGCIALWSRMAVVMGLWK